VLIASESLLGPNPPTSAYLEAYRILRSEFLTLQEHEEFRIVLVTSPWHQEGKSTVVLNLGTMLALIERDTIVIDADFYGGGIGETLGISGSPGLTDLCLHDIAVAETVMETELSALRVVPAGTEADRGPELTEGASMGQALRKIGQQAQFVLCDSTPLSGFGATLALARMVDMVLLVSLAGSRVEDVQRCLASLKEAGAQVGGIIVNDELPGESVVYRSYNEYHR